MDEACRNNGVQNFKTQWLFKLKIIIWCFLSIRRIGWSRNQGVEAGVAMATFIPNGLRGHFVLLMSATLSSEDWEAIPAKERTLLPGDTARVPPNYNSRLPSGCLEHFVFWNQQVKRGHATASGVSYDPYQKEAETLSSTVVKFSDWWVICDLFSQSASSFSSGWLSCCGNCLLVWMREKKIFKNICYGVWFQDLSYPWDNCSFTHPVCRCARVLVGSLWKWYILLLEDTSVL